MLKIFNPFLLLSAFACLSRAIASEAPLHLVPAYPNLTFDDTATALAITVDGKARRMVVALQKGQLRSLPEDRNSGEAPLFLDLSEQIKGQFSFEDGLHGLAFHPSFTKERRVYVCYSRLDPRRTVLSEFTVPKSESFVADPASERVLLEFAHPMGNHWGGGIAFGPDGFLYLGIGDGGVRNDPYRLGQNLWTLHGKIIRIDVNGRSSGLAYAIPADNPFTDKQEVRDEIWASGIRNPWGMSFDRATGTFWCADVGQDAWEEVNLIQKGGNYGWSEREGPSRFTGRTQTPEESATFIEPIHAYPRSEGISITGGYVYRGKRLRGIHGSYLFGDWGAGKIWALSWDEKTKAASGARQLYASTPDTPRFNPTVIAPDAAGEPLLFSHSPSVIYTLREQTLLADAETPEEILEEFLPTVDDVIDAPEDTVPDGGAS
jgi:glucose/arabinose dehydrogenase